MDLLSQNLKINILMVEYPGYGVYKGISNAANIEKDSIFVYEFLIK